MSLPSDRDLPLVSIVIPVYNGARYMREAIDSALGQTYPNCEVIVVNDGSPDDGATDAVARSYGDRIRYFVKPNGGCGSALNHGIAHMRGEFFSWLSHDDAYRPDKIARQVELHRTSGKRDPIVFCGYELMDASSVHTGDVRPHAVLDRGQLEIPLLPLLRGLIHGCALLIPRRYFDEVGMFDESLPTTQDYDLWFRLLRVAPLVYDEHLLVRSRVHPAQDTHRKWHQHIAECNALWTGFLGRLTDEEMSLMEGSPYRFLARTAAFLATTPYAEARQQAEELAGRRLAATRISVVVPFRDRIAWVLEAVASVQAQTHPNWELILVDDGSSDPIAPVVARAETDDRIRYVRQPAGGPAAARNHALRLATGAYVAFLDSDDLFEPEKLERQLRFMEDHGLAISHTSYRRISPTGEPAEVIPSAAFCGDVFPAIIGGCTIAMPTVMAKRDVFCDHVFPEANEIGEDVCLWIEIAAGLPWGGLDLPLTRVRVGEQSAAVNPRKQTIGLLNIALHCLRREHLACHPDQIHRLVAAAARLLEQTPTQRATRATAVRSAARPLEQTLAQQPPRATAIHSAARTPRHTTSSTWSTGRAEPRHPLKTLRDFPGKVGKEFGRAVRKIRRAIGR